MNAFIVSLYIGYALYGVFPFAASIESMAPSGEATFALDVLMYAALSAIAYVIVKRFVDRGYYEWWRMGILGLLALGFILALLYHVFGFAGIFTLPFGIPLAFAPKAYFFWWFIAPLVGLLLFVR